MAADILSQTVPTLSNTNLNTNAPGLNPTGLALGSQSYVPTSGTRESGPQDQSDDDPQITELEPQKSVDRHEPPIPAWKRLISRPFPIDERISLITDIFSNSIEVDMVNRLHGDDAQTFVDVTDEVPPCSFASEEC